jgi:hypothetical protein
VPIIKPAQKHKYNTKTIHKKKEALNGNDNNNNNNNK